MNWQQWFSKTGKMKKYFFDHRMPIGAISFFISASFMLCPLAYSDQTVQDFYKHDAIKCKDLVCIRNKIDEINDKMITLLVERTSYVQRAGDLKIRSGIADDQKRVNDQIKLLEHRSEKLGLPKEIVIEAFRLIMNESIQFQQRYIDKRIQEQLNVSKK
jgi:isochorismate pyruvate lyase